LGLLASDLEHTLQASSLRECKTMLDDQGITHVELEFLVDWFVQGEKRTASDEQRAFLFAAADVLQPALIKVGDFGRTACPLPRLIDEFGALCAQARSHGTKVAFEPMEAAVVSTLDDALTLVQGAGAPNGGLAIDVWHMAQLGVSFEAVARIPKEYLLCVEVNDAVWEPAPHRGPSVDRRFCGEGELDLAGFRHAIERTGYDGPWGVEIFSDRLLSMDLNDAAQKAYRTTAALWTKKEKQA
jgi:sugar phosphate isomerase/epimerase